LPEVADEMRSVRRHDLDSVTIISKVHRPAIPPSGSTVKSGVSSGVTTFSGLQDWSTKSELVLFAFRYQSRNRVRELLCGRSIPKPFALQDLESQASDFGLSEITDFLVKADILENKEENERDSW
jgi:hypothetical protein